MTLADRLSAGLAAVADGPNPPNPYYVHRAHELVAALEAWAALPTDADEAAGLAALERVGRAALAVDAARAERRLTRCEAPHREGMAWEPCGRCYPCEIRAALAASRRDAARFAQPPVDAIWAAAHRAVQAHQRRMR